MATAFPLPKDFFNTSSMRLSEDERRQHIEYAESSIRQVFALSDIHRNSWIPVREKKGVAVYRNFGQTRGPTAYKSNIAEVGGKGDMQASLDEVARAYSAHDDALFRRLMKKLNPGVLDAAVLCTIVPRTPLAPCRYIGIKWFAVKTPTPLVSHRDYCCLEVTDKIQDSFGNEMYIRILNSIEIKECPSLENSHGLVRGKMLAGFMYRADRAEPLVVRIHHVARFDPAGYFPSQWAYKTAESQLVCSVQQIKRIVEKQQMNACTFVDKKQWVPNHERLHCAVCSRQFGTFRPRHHCRCCGEVICGKCSIFKSVDVPGTTLKNVRICSICNMGVQKSRSASRSTRHGLGLDHGNDAMSSQDDEMSDISTSSVTSSSTIAHNEMNLMDLYLSASNGYPSTPSAYSTASAQSNLSMRSTSSSRSAFGGGGNSSRSHAGAGGASGTTTPVTARFFKSGGPGHNIFSSSSRMTMATTAAMPASSTPGGGSGGERQRSGSQTPRSFFNESSHTPRSYIGGNLTPRTLAGYGVTTATATATATSAPPPPRDGPQTPCAQEQRMSVFKQNPLDLGYLRDSVRMPATQTQTQTQTQTGPDTTTTTMITSTTPARARGESSADALPPAKMPRLVTAAANNDDNDVDMDHDQTATVMGEDHTELTRSTAYSTTASDSSTMATAATGTVTSVTFTAAAAAAAQPLASTTPDATKKSFLGGLFSRSSLESKPAASAS